MKWKGEGGLRPQRFTEMTPLVILVRTWAKVKTSLWMMQLVELHKHNNNNNTFYSVSIRS